MSGPSLATVVVHVDEGDDVTNRITLARHLADAHGATLRGVAAGDAVIPVYAPFGETLVSLQPALVEQLHKDIKRRLDSAERTFRSIAGAEGEWRSAQVLKTAQYVAQQGRSADLLVVGRAGSTDPEDGVTGVRPADVLELSGRPVLVVPPRISMMSARRVVIAWKEARECHRAIADALPFIRRCEEVFVASIGDDDQTGPTADVAAYLGRYGAAAKVVQQKRGPAYVADDLIEIAQRVDADLIVSGAFGHSRMQEWILGGVTRDLLDRSPVCCLMSH